MKPLIGITAGTIYNKERPYSPFTYGQMHTYVEAVSEAGGLPVIIPILTDDAEAHELFARLDGILFAGGEDISPAYYHQENRHAKVIDEPRDAHEMRLMKWALETGMPILAICRGMQLLNIARGGTLYQDLQAELPAAHNHDGYLDVKDTKHLAHTLKIEANSTLGKLVGETIKSNTHHHQAVNQVGDGLFVNAHADDGVVEGIEDMSQAFVLGIQCHPESLFNTVQPEWQPVFDAFISASKRVATPNIQARG